MQPPDFDNIKKYSLIPSVIPSTTIGPHKFNYAVCAEVWCDEMNCEVWADDERGCEIWGEDEKGEFGTYFEAFTFYDKLVKSEKYYTAWIVRAYENHTDDFDDPAYLTDDDPCSRDCNLPHYYNEKIYGE